MNIIVDLALIVIALGVLGVGAIMYARLREVDRVLAALAGYEVILERRDGLTYSGVLQVTATGLDLRTAIRGRDTQPALPAHTLIYAVEYDDIQAIILDLAGLSEQERRRRQGARYSRSRRGRRPGLRQVLKRLGDAADSLIAPHTHLTRLAWGEEATPLTPQRVLGYEGNRWDPMLERSLGQGAIFQCVLGRAQYERMGVLAAYDRRFLLFRDALFPRSQLLTLAADQPQMTTADVQLQREGRRLEISNRSAYPLLLDDIRMAGRVRELGMMIGAGDSFAIYLDQPASEPCELHCQVVRQVDIVLPRRTTLLRYRTETTDILPIFDAGLLLQSSAAEQTREEELRWELRQHPHNALAAASLGRLLYRQGRWAEAEQYLQQALHAPKALPDEGQRVREELNQLRRRQGEITGTTV